MSRYRSANEELNSDHRISYWLKGQGKQNFGDLLSELLFRALTRASWTDPRAGGSAGGHDVIHLLGSVISVHHIKMGLEHARAGPGKRIAFWGCGKRDAEAIDGELLASCDLLGVRGPLTRDALNLPPETPIGDPGLLIPLLHEPRPLSSVAGKTICVPHFLDTLSDAELLERTGADLVVRPNIPANLGELLGLVDTIASARFVLAGALHAAIVAAALDVPFSYFDSGYIDVPFKWEDFARSVAIPTRFATTVREGVSIHDNDIKRAMRKPRLEPLLACAPLRAPRALLARARARDATV